MKKTINGLAIWTEGNKKNRPIIFVHGFPYDHFMWTSQIETLKDDYYCVTYDLRGLGKSRVGDGQYTLEMYVDDLFAIIKDLKLKKPVLCGLSMGGYISLRAVERDESKFGGLILCDTRAEADSDEGKLIRAAKIKTINEKGFEKFAVPFVRNCFADISRRNKKIPYKATLERSLKSKPVGVKGALLAMVSRTDTTHVLPKIKLKTLVLVGSLDTMTPPPVMRAMAEKIKKSDFGIVPRSGHMSPIENPGFITDMIKGFLKKLK